MPRNTPAYAATVTDNVTRNGRANPTSEPPLSIKDIEGYGQQWLYDCQFRQHSPRTTEFRQHVINKLVWYLNQQGRTTCQPADIRAFLAYVTTGHQELGGRWGNPSLTKPVRPATIHRYFRELRTLFRWMVEEGVLIQSPLDSLRAPKVPQDQIKPFTRQQIESLLEAAGRSLFPLRDTALVLFMLDTGARASELTGAKMCDLNMREHTCLIHGKGGKSRTICFGRATAKALLQYLRMKERQEGSAVFLAEGGRNPGEPLDRTGLLHFVYRLGKSAAISGVRCSPHTFRHTFDVEFLRAGGHLFSLQTLMGHSSLSQTQRYVALAQADIQNQHRQFSPADHLHDKHR